MNSWPELLCRKAIFKVSQYIKKIFTSVNQVFYLENVKAIYNLPTDLTFFSLLGYLYCAEIDTTVAINGIVRLSSKANKKMLFF